MPYYILYRAMCKEEFRNLINYGFFSSKFFQKREKHFTPNEEYIWIILNTNFGNNSFSKRYEIVVRFFIKSDIELPYKIVEKRFLDYIITKDLLNFISDVRYVRVNNVRKPDPLIVFKNKRGYIREIYRFSELEGIIINPGRILWINKFLIDVCLNSPQLNMYSICSIVQKLENI